MFDFLYHCFHCCQILITYVGRARIIVCCCCCCCCCNHCDVVVVVFVVVVGIYGYRGRCIGVVAVDDLVLAIVTDEDDAWDFGHNVVVWIIIYNNINGL